MAGATKTDRVTRKADRVVERRRRILTFSMFSSAYVLSYLQRVSLTVVAAALQENLATGPTGLGILSSAYFLAYACAQPLVGLLSDRIGPIVVSATLLVVGAAGSFLFASARSLPAAVVARVLVGAGVSGVFVPGMKAIASLYAADEFARMNGLFLSAGYIGALVGTMPMAALAGAIGWRGSFAAIGGVSLVLGAAFWATAAGSRCAAPGLGLTPNAPAAQQGHVDSWRQAFSKPQLWLISVLLFCKYGSQISFQGLWGVPYLVGVYDLSVEKAASMVMMVAVGNAIGAPVLGDISDRVLRRRRGLLLASLVVYVLTWVPIVLLPGRVSEVLLYVILFLMGFSAGSTTLAFALVKDGSAEGMSGAAAGIANVAAIAGGAVVPSLVGQAIAYIGRSVSEPSVLYRYSLLPCLIAALVSLGMIVFVEERSGSADLARANGGVARFE